MVMKLFVCDKCGKKEKALATEMSHPCLKNSLTRPERMTLVCEKHKIEADGAGHKVCLTCRRTN